MIPLDSIKARTVPDPKYPVIQEVREIYELRPPKMVASATAGCGFI